MKLLHELMSFKRDAGLSEHRVGILVANNGRIIPRLREGGRVWPDTEAAIRKRIEEHRAKRGLVHSERQNLSTEVSDA